MAKEPTENQALLQTLQSIDVSLQQIANTLAILAVESSSLKENSLTENVVLLNSWGLNRNRIASILGTTPGSVSVRLSEAKKAKERKDKPKRNQQ